MLDLRRLIKNIANLKNKETAKNKFLKTKPKIQEMKQNVDKARDEAIAIHDYVKRAVVAPDPEKVIPIFEANSITVGFEYIAEQLQLIGSSIPSNPTQIQTLATAADAIQAFAPKMELGIAVTNSGIRYLTTRARSSELGGSFTPITNSFASSLLGATSGIK